MCGRELNSNGSSGGGGDVGIRNQILGMSDKASSAVWRLRERRVCRCGVDETWVWRGIS